jgi:hypothetical protein
VYGGALVAANGQLFDGDHEVDSAAVSDLNVGGLVCRELGEESVAVV